MHGWSAHAQMPSLKPCILATTSFAVSLRGAAGGGVEPAAVRSTGWVDDCLPPHAAITSATPNRHALTRGA
jgi:hypothetical protein